MISSRIVIPNILGNVTIHALEIPINNMMDSIKIKLVVLGSIHVFLPDSLFCKFFEAKTNAKVINVTGYDLEI